MAYITLAILLAFTIGLVINYIIINRKPKRTDYSGFYEGLNERRIKRLEEERPDTRECATWTDEELWEFINPLIERSKDNYFNFISLVKDRLIRQEPEFILTLDNTFLKLLEPHCNELNFNIAKRIFPEDDWFFLLYMSFLISKGEQRFNWLATYPHDLFKQGFEINSNLSISGACGYSYFRQLDKLIPNQTCFLQKEPILWNDDVFKSKEPELFNLLQRVE